MWRDLVVDGVYVRVFVRLRAVSRHGSGFDVGHGSRSVEVRERALRRSKEERPEWDDQAIDASERMLCLDWECYNGGVYITVRWEDATDDDNDTREQERKEIDQK